MATVSDAVKVLSVELGEEESFVKQVARRLIDDDELPKSRGRDLAHVDALDVVRLMLAVLTTDRVNRSTERALTYSRLHGKGDPSMVTFGLFLSHALDNLRELKPIEINDEITCWYDQIQFEVVTSYPVAFVRCAGDILNRPKPFEGDLVFAEDEKRARIWPDSKPRKSVTIPGHAIFNVATALNRDLSHLRGEGDE